jgi:hypothetical protein
MSDLELYIYIGLILIYFLSRALRKKKTDNPPVQKSGSPSNRDAYEKASTEERPMTFEDLLKEFTGQREEVTPTVEVEEPVEVETNPQDESSIENEGETSYNDYKSYNENLYENYEETYKSYEEVFGKQDELVTLDEQVDFNRPRGKRFEGYKIQEEENIHVAQRCRKMLMNRVSIKDAIILKEILDRKYF